MAAESAKTDVGKQFEKQERNILGVLWVAVLFLLVAVLAYPTRFWLFKGLGLSSSQEVWGQFGDYIGGVLNPIIGIAGTVGLLFSLKYNSEAIRISTDTLNDERAKSQASKQESALNEARSRTNLMYQTWISGEMQRLRTELWSFLNQQIDNRQGRDSSFPANTTSTRRSQSQIAYLGSLRNTADSRSFYAIGTISHFVGDLSRMVKYRLVDNEMLGQLLGPSLMQWREIYEQISFLESSDDTNQTLRRDEDWHKSVWTEELVALLTSGE